MHLGRGISDSEVLLHGLGDRGGTLSILKPPT